MGQSQGMDHGDRGHHGVFAHRGGMQAVVLLALLFALVNAPSVTVWVTFGTALRRWLTDLRHLRVFNVSMAIMLVLSLYPLLFG